MRNQKIKFVTGFGNFGGSTLAILEHCRLLEENGFDVYFYASGDWHLSRFKKSYIIDELEVEPDDIVIFHHIDLEIRPKCKRSILYVHEKSLWSLDNRNLFPFDSIVYVSEDQANYHGVKGTIIPNPVNRMVDLSLNNPPNSNVAGIVGTIQERKAQHESINKAIEDNRSKILLFGDFEERYFNSKIKPLLSEKVIYMGLTDPENKMKMYNQFDYLYIFSNEESASLTLGECRLLGKKIFKSSNVLDYEILNDVDIVRKWEELFCSTYPVIKEFSFSSSDHCDNLVCVVTHNRKNLVGRWLRAWNNAEKFGSKIAVFHACDNKIPDQDEMNNILSYYPDFYIPFINSPLKDMRALHIALRDVFEFPEWKNIFWFTDDMMPMRRDFLYPFVDKLKENVGLVAQCYEPINDSYTKTVGFGCLPHIRTVAYGLSRAAADSIIFPYVGEEQERPYLLEHGKIGLYEDHILKQVTQAGFDFALCHSDFENYTHWTKNLDWMWDCHLFSEGAEINDRKLSSHEMWNVYEQQFAYPRSFDPLVIFHPEKCEKLTLKKGKISAIIPTFSSPMKCFMLSVFSLLIRSNPNVLDHLFFSINGPDAREGGNELQDKKQSFLEELRSLNWSGFGVNPGNITISRTWSRIGHSQALEQCIPWIDTEFYLSMHDDVIVLNDSWCDLKDFVENESMIMKTWGCIFSNRLKSASTRLDLPHLNTIFTLCNKPLMTRLGVSWSGFSFDFNLKISDYIDLEEFKNNHKKIDSLEFGANFNEEYKSISLDIGSFIFSKIFSLGLDLSRFDHDTVFHFESMSWKFKEVFSNIYIEKIEEDIRRVSQYNNLYKKYLNE